jgi:phosphoserine phosphatase RsbU/P
VHRIAAVLDDSIARAGSAEDFATAALIRYHLDGRLDTITCGHPAPLVINAHGIRSLQVDRALPLGLGSRPAAVTDFLGVGERLLLYTDGLIEARDAAGQFFPLSERADVLYLDDLETALDALLGRVVWHARGAPDDDLALLLAERRW